LAGASIIDAYDNIFDAIRRAYELGADSHQVAITIVLLLDGVHSLRREVRQYRYRPMNIDKNSQNIDLIIKTSVTGT
jgi:hypothetical protein